MQPVPLTHPIAGLSVGSTLMSHGRLSTASPCRRTSLGEVSQSLALTQQAARVLAWLARHDLLAPLPPSQSTSGGAPSWPARISASRRRTPSHRLFLDDLLEGVSTVGQVAAVVYPPRSLHEAARVLFLQGVPSDAAHRAKLGVMVYYLMDAGYLSADLLQVFGVAMGIPSAQLAQWEASQLLDSADPTRAEAATQLDRAASLLAGNAGPGTPFRAVEALLALGRPSAALAVHSARRASRGSGLAVDVLEEEATLLQVRALAATITVAFFRSGALPWTKPDQNETERKPHHPHTSWHAHKMGKLSRLQQWMQYATWQPSQVAPSLVV